MSSTARSITGDVNFSNEKLMISFSTFPIAQIRPLQPSEIVAAFDLDETSGVSGNLFRLSIPGSRRFLHKNTLCGAEDVQWMITSVSDSGLQVALFSGQKVPVLTHEAITTSTDLCGTFSYAK